MGKSSVKSSKATTKASKSSKKQVKKQEESSSESSSEASSSSSESESEDDSSDSESESGSSSSSSSDSDSDSDSDSSDEAEEKKEAKKEESNSDSDSGSSDEEEEKKETKKETKKEESDSDSSSDSDSDSDSDSSSDEEEDKKESKKASSSSSDSDSDSDSDSSSDSDSDSESETESKAESSKKRKADESSETASQDSSEEVPEAKKAKTTEEPATLFVGRLSWNIDDEWLRREFEPLGGVIAARVMMERSTGKSRGYGYVDFESKSAAEKALNEYQGKEIDGRPVNLDLSTSKPRPSNPRVERAKQFGDVPSAPSDTLFIGNLSFNATRDGLFSAFGEYGQVISCRIPTHPDTEQPKGFGYVQFSSVDEAKAALEALNGEYIEGRACRLDYSTPKEPNSNRGSPARFGGNRGGFGGRERSSPGPRSSPAPRSSPSTAAFKGTKKTFD